ncbi:MAG: V-type ATP synthase subunit K [Candidatus ainarchaeum sp.]|nr:V-type ATP synthase subunit K [Candidatus ainarchaeum sp.]
MADPTTAASVAATVTGTWLGDPGAIALSAAIAMLGAAAATAAVQSSVGSSAMGVIAERPEESSKLLIYYLIPESILIFGFIVSYLIVSKITNPI